MQLCNVRLTYEQEGLCSDVTLNTVKFAHVVTSLWDHQPKSGTFFGPLNRNTV